MKMNSITRITTGVTIRAAVFAVVVALFSSLGFAQSTGTVQGTCKDTSGQPIASAIVQLQSPENGREYKLKTNNKGQYFSLGIQPGDYTITLLQGDKQLFQTKHAHIGVGDNPPIDINLQEQQAAAAKGQGLTPEQLKQMQEQQAKQQKEQGTVKQLNEKIAIAIPAMKSGDFDTAITQLNEATQIDATRDVVWADLAEAYAGSATKQTDPAEKTKRYTEAVTDYQKAIDLKQQHVPAGLPPSGNDAKVIASYYNNLGQSQAQLGKSDDAMKSYTQAAQLDPTGAGQYYYNLGAVLTNGGKAEEAIAAFDKAIAADPNRADAYYWKGVNLMAKATTQGDKMVAPDGTAEAFNKYLELQPTGQFADPAKQMLASIGAKVETSFGTKKSSTKKK